MQLYAWGSNGSRQLGLEHADDVSSPTPSALPAALCAQPPLKIVAGGNHTPILWASGRLLILGDKSPLTDSDFLIDLTTPKAFLAYGVKDCAATWDSFTIMTAGGISTFGNGEKGQLGRGKEILHQSSHDPYLELGDLLEPGVEIVDLASGVQHTVVILSNGEVIGWGNGRKGQLGEPAELVWSPRKVNGIGFKVVKAVCGREFTCLFGAAGLGNHKVLGSDKWGIQAKAPLNMAGWKQIGANWGSIHVLFESGKVLSWGRDDHGQLVPQNLPPIEQIAVGSEHTIALSQRGEVIAWGWGEHGNCGKEVDKDGDVKGRWGVLVSRYNIKEMHVQIVGAGCATSFMWVDG